MADARLAAQALAELVDEFEAGIGRRPWAAELAELLTEGVRPPPEGLDGVTAVRLDTAPPATAPPGGSLVRELNDACFVAAADLLAEATALAAERGPVTPEAVAAILGQVLRGDARVPGDEPPVALASVALVTGARGRRAKIGDLVGIPVGDGAVALAVVVARNALGVAYGLFQGRHPAEPVGAADHPPIDPYPVYSTDEPVRAGRWPILAHEPELAALFPDDPEIYHYAHPDEGRPVPRAQRLGGESRDVPPDEARAVGLEDETYRQVWLPEELEGRLRSGS